MWVRFPPGPPSARRSRLVRLALLSAFIHLGVLLLLVLRLHAPEQENSPPPADIAMVFQSGSPKPAESPKPARPDRPPAKAAPPPAPRAETPAAEKPPAAVRPAPPLPAVPAPQPQAAPKAEATPPAVTLPTPRAPPIPQPHPAPKSSTASRAPAAPPPALRPPSRPSRSASTKFPSPIMRSFFIPSTASTASHQFTHDFSSGEPAVQRGVERNNPYDLRGADQLGSDWSNEFMQWVDEHKYYPDQAIANDEDGNSGVQFTVDRYGRVTGVRLVRRSGSVWLDMGLTGMFRDARLPPFPPGAPGKDVTITFTMHYILER